MSFAADNEGGGASTNWFAYDVPAMWALVGDFDTNPQWTHVTAWKKTADLTSLHLSHMRAYREQLATAWPPDKNEASRVYVGYLDKLIASVQSTYDAAIANHDTMAGATGAIMMAKATLRPLYDRWKANAALMAEYDSQVAFAQESQVPVPMAGPPPLPPGWRDDLNRQARQLMSGLSGELSLATVKVVMPPGYASPRMNIDPGKDLPSDSNPPSMVPPVIPPVVPVRAPLPAPSPAFGPWEGGPSLAESPTTSVSAGPPVGRTAPTRDLPSEPIRIIGTVPGTALPRISPSLTPPTVIGGTPPSVSGTLPGPTRTSTAQGVTSRPLPSGMVIGGQPRSTEANVPSASRQGVNPTGGVIGRQPPSSANRGTAGNVIAPRPPARTMSRSETEKLWDPDDPWVTGEGVPPVLFPSTEPAHHDPGPAIGRDN